MLTHSRFLSTLRIALPALAIVLLLVTRTPAAPTSGTLIQACTTAPAQPAPAGALMGCPRAHVEWVAPAAGTLVRASRGGVQQWVAFGALTAADSVVAQVDGTWHTVGSIIIVKATPTQPADPPINAPAQPADYTVTWLGNPPMGAVFPKLPSDVTQCFTLSAGTRSQQLCLPPHP